jgi:hypothetical protein
MNDFSWLSFITSSFVATLISVAVSYYINHRSLKAKLTDRLYEFNKLQLSHPEAFAGFWQHANRTRDDYFSSAFKDLDTKKDKSLFEYRAIAHYYLNMFEEMYFAHRTLDRQEPCSSDWHAWREYIFGRLRHPLIRETICTVGDIKKSSSGLTAGNKGEFSKEFIEFLCANGSHWHKKKVEIGKL